METILNFLAISLFTLAVLAIIIHGYIHYFMPEVRKSKKERERVSKEIEAAYYCRNLLK